MLPLCLSRIITEEGPVLLAVSMNCHFGEVLRGDQGDFCHPQVTARWTVPSRVYHGSLFCLKFILHLWGLCFMSNPLVLPWDGAQHPQTRQGPKTGTIVPSGCGGPCSPRAHFGPSVPPLSLFCYVISRGSSSSTNILRPIYFRV